MRRDCGLPSNTLSHDEVLYQDLLNTTLRVKRALSTKDHDSLAALAPIHQQQMSQLLETDRCRSLEVVNLIQELQRQVDDVMIELNNQKNHARKQMRALGRGRQLSAAYGAQTFGYATDRRAHSR
jgi:hypothetical protein